MLLNSNINRLDSEHMQTSDKRLKYSPTCVRLEPACISKEPCLKS